MVVGRTPDPRIGAKITRARDSAAPFGESIRPAALVYDMATIRPSEVHFYDNAVHQPRRWFSLPRTLATRLSAAENGIVRSSHRASRLCGAVLHVKFHVSNILSKLGLERRTELVPWHEPI